MRSKQELQNEKFLKKNPAKCLLTTAHSSSMYFNWESTEGSSKCIVNKNHDKLETRISLNKYNMSIIDKVSVGENITCRHTKRVANLS